MLSNDQRKAFFATLFIICLFTATFFGLGVDSYRLQQAQKASFWQEDCVITSCIAATPSKDRVTFQSSGHFARNNTTTLARGCKIYPIDSTVTCYVNADIVILERPGAGRAWIAGMVFGGILGTILFIILFVWFMEECFSRATAEYETVPADESLATPGNPTNSVGLEDLAKPAKSDQ